MEGRGAASNPRLSWTVEIGHRVSPLAGAHRALRDATWLDVHVPREYGRRVKHLFQARLLVAALLSLSACAITPRGRARRLECVTEGSPRAREICRSIARHLQWRVWGHGAAFMPGWRVEPETLKNVVCDMKLSAEDLPALNALALRYVDGNLNVMTAAQALVRIYEPGAAYPGSVYDRASPQFVLQGACPR
jgi:hypothetical protein